MLHPNYPFLRVVCLVVAVSAGISCRSSDSTPAAAPVTPDTWAVVNGKAITRAQVEGAFSRVHDPAQVLSNEETLTAKLELLNDLIVQEILLAKASALKVELTDAELNTAYDNAKRNIPEEAFQQELTKRGLTPTDMREGLRQELLAQKVITHELASKTAVSEQEITDFFNANRSRFNVPEEGYQLAQIVVTPQREPQVTNGTGDDAATPEAAAAKVEMLMGRLKEGASFRDLAVGYSEDAETSPRGGDLGFVPVSRIKGLAPPLQKAVLNQKPGTVNVASAGGVHTLVAVVSHELPGQRDLSSPGVRERITETLRARKEQLFRTAYLTAIRNDAVIENHLARQLVESGAQAPALQVGVASPK